MSDGVTITLGARNYEIVAQPIGRIRRKLVKIIGLAEGVVGIDGEIDSDLHSVFKTFIPDLAPLYELMGFASADAYERGEEPDDDAYDKHSPTVPQVIEAVEAIYRVNGADRLVKLGKDLVGADVIRHRLRKAVMSSDLSVSSPAPSGESDSESSTATLPTSPETSEEPSPSLDSSTSSKPGTAAA